MEVYTVYERNYWPGAVTMYFVGSFVAINTSAVEIDAVGNVTIYIRGYYALYDANLTFMIHNHTQYSIYCIDNSTQFFDINLDFQNDSYDKINKSEYVQVYHCQRNTTSTNDHVATHLVHTVLPFIESIVATSDSINSNNNDDNCNHLHLTHDIGYPYNAETNIVNWIKYGYIWCRGFKSCYGATIIRSNYGNVVCLAKQSCVETVIWTFSDSNNNIDNGQLFNDCNNNTNTTINNNNATNGEVTL